MSALRSHSARRPAARAQAPPRPSRSAPASPRGQIAPRPHRTRAITADAQSVGADQQAGSDQDQPRRLRQLTPDSAHVVVSLSKQRAYLLERRRDRDRQPDFLRQTRRHDADRAVLRHGKGQGPSLERLRRFRGSHGPHGPRGISARIDSAPSGTHYVGAPMKWFMRLTGEGVGMHVGILPGYPASHGCIRMPAAGCRAVLQSRQDRHAGRGRAVPAQSRSTAALSAPASRSPQHLQRGLRREVA